MFLSFSTGGLPLWYQTKMVTPECQKCTVLKKMLCQSKYTIWLIIDKDLTEIRARTIIFIIQSHISSSFLFSLNLAKGGPLLVSFGVLYVLLPEYLQPAALTW